MANIASQFMDLNVFFQDGNWAGRVEGYTPPELSSQVEEYRASGMHGSVALRTGQDLMESEIVFKGHHQEIYTSWGVMAGDNNHQEIVVRGALRDYEGEIKNIVFTQTGPIVKVMGDQIQGQGEVPEMTVTQNPHYFKVEYNGTEVVEIDIINSTQKINGVDQLEAIRDALGL